MSETRYRKGDVVKFQAGTRFLQGVIKEDRGPIGIKGRRIYLIEFQFSPHAEGPSQIELPAEEFERVQDAVSTD